MVVILSPHDTEDALYAVQLGQYVIYLMVLAIMSLHESVKDVFVGG